MPRRLGLALAALTICSPFALAVEPSNQAALLRQKLAERDRLQAEIDQLRAATETPATVCVNVKVMEVNLTKLRQLGADPSLKTPAGLSAKKIAELLAAEGGHQLGSNSMAQIVDLLEANNVARVLADPCVMTVSGRPASLHVGGEFPMPAAPGAETTVEYQEFGTRLDLTAESLGDRQVRLAINLRLSEINEGRAVVIEGQRVPALHVTECNTVCKMRFGETIPLSGLVTKRTESIVDDSGSVQERTAEIAQLIVLRADDADDAPRPDARTGGRARCAGYESLTNARTR